MRDAITEFVKIQLNTQHISAKELELDLKQSIEESMSNSWAEQPAYVFESNVRQESTVVVAFVLDYAAAGSMSVIQVYQGGPGKLTLVSEGGREMNDCDMQILRVTPPESGQIRLFTFGAIFGANQAVSHGVLYAIRDSRLVLLWRTRDYQGLSAHANQGRLTLEYRDPKRYYSHTPPYSFRDVYIQTTNGVQRISHAPLAADR